MKTLKLKDFPTLAAQVKRWVPGYRKHSVMVAVAERETPFGWWWDEGSKSDYATARIGGSGTTPWYPPQYPETKAQPIPTGGETVVVETGVFCGKPATMQLTIHPNDLARLGLSPEDTKR
tara:strand:+ start:2045 stop:2404 length:360 start_codon:yes stop_codon:yes gene_type:complete